MLLCNDAGHEQFILFDNQVPTNNTQFTGLCVSVFVILIDVVFMFLLLLNEIATINKCFGLV